MRIYDYYSGISPLFGSSNKFTEKKEEKNKKKPLKLNMLM
jgi:hypothetical protein